MRALLPAPPTKRQLADVADSWGLDLKGREASLFAEVIDAGLANLAALEPLLGTRPLRSTRHPGASPRAAENPLGAWAHRGDLREREDGPLAGYDIAIKDSIAVAGMPMRNGSRATQGFVPDADAVVVSRILEAGGRIVGKAQCEDFCQGAQSFTSAPEPVRNPHDASRSAGGSSSGSAALVGGGVVPMAIGGDSAGSIRVPSAYCGAVGLKPTFGTVPFTGSSSLEMSLEHLGPITATVDQNELLFSVIAGASRTDPRARTHPLKEAHRNTASALRVAVLSEGFAREASDPAVAAEVMGVSERLARAGIAMDTSHANILDAAEGMHIVIYLIGMTRLFRQRGTGAGWIGTYPSDQADVLPRWLADRGALPDTLLLSLLAGSYLDQSSGVDLYARAQNARHALTDAVDAALDGADALLMPTATTVAPPIPDRKVGRAERLLASASAASNAPAFNLTGHPAISVPCGTAHGLPVGAMLVARHGDEATLFELARAVEANAERPGASTHPT